MEKRQMIIIGGGPAGLAAASAARDAGIEDILIIERDDRPGGILNQCIHNGFGLHTFKEELTGPEYAGRYMDMVADLEIEIMLHTMVMDINGDRVVTCMNKTQGLMEIQGDAIILAMGCRERPRGALNIPGSRPAGIYTAGTAQRLVNMEGLMPGKKVVILGSGDIGLIMARRMTLEGADVQVVAELMPYSGGLKRNIVQCLDDFEIPLKLSHTVTDIRGRERLEGVTIAEVGPDRKPIPGTETDYDCDTLLLSVGLIPENELSEKIGVTLNGVTSGPLVDECFETNVPGVFACGNVLHVHDLVDFVSEEAAQAGRNAARYILGKLPRENPEKQIQVVSGAGISYTVPNTIDPERAPDSVKIRFRVRQIFKDQRIIVTADGVPIKHKKRRIMAPGEMEEIVLTQGDLGKKAGIKEIRLEIGE
ncbi:NAD(P)/FAD-dependent oxidoreductase [Eubacterium sp.]|uniref:NAD(P)/FAD-dependent oxidoreductase n=1 Tax=Eubacterium sp. TaxID=142586 RepID=UPI002FCA2D8D